MLEKEKKILHTYADDDGKTSEVFPSYFFYCFFSYVAPIPLLTITLHR